MHLFINMYSLGYFSLVRIFGRSLCWFLYLHNKGKNIFNNHGEPKQQQGKLELLSGDEPQPKKIHSNDYGELFSAWMLRRRAKDPYCICGKSKLQENDNQNRIIGGGIAAPHKFPWIVRIVGGCSGGEHIFFISIPPKKHNINLVCLQNLL